MQVVEESSNNDGGGGGDPNQITEEIPIPAGKVGMVIGRGGETIKRLQDQSGCRLQMIQDDPYAENKPLRMTGDRESVDKARALVDDLISDREDVSYCLFVRCNAWLPAF